MRFLALLGVATLALASARPVAAQQIETPVAFDSAGRVRGLTPQLVSRYGLAAPAWPVQGTFVEARLFSVSGGAHVLTVERSGGTMERYSLAEAEVSAIRASVDAAMTLTGAGGRRRLRRDRGHIEHRRHRRPVAGELHARRRDRRVCVRAELSTHGEVRGHPR